MSETERQRLRSVLVTKTKNKKDLSSLITSISEANRRELLERLTNWYLSKHSELRNGSKYSELRGYPRKPLKIPIEFSKNGFTFISLTQDISRSGVFIHTDFSFNIDQHITMILSPSEIEKDITIGGRIVRVGSNGIGVKFDALLRNL
jgi:hypothetical protein